MKSDPNKLCVPGKQVLIWAMIHDLISHPLLVVSFYSRWAIRFHDWTSLRAWPEQPPREDR